MLYIGSRSEAFYPGDLERLVAPESIRILLVDDDLGDQEMTRAMLSQAQRGRYELDWVSTYEEALDALQRRAHDLYLVDYLLEDRSGLDLLREARRRGIDAPVILLTGRGSREVDLDAMEAGAADYLVKGRIDPELLERSVRYALERARAARALRESEQRHRSMFDHLPVGLFRSLPDGGFLDANPALIRLLGYPDKDTLERLYSKNFYVSPEDRQHFIALLERFGVVRGFESVLRRPDGSQIRIRNTARLHRDPDGKVAYLEGTAEEVPRALGSPLDGARFQALFEHTSAGVALLDLEGQVLKANPAFRSIFRTRSSDEPDLFFGAFLAEGDRPGVIRELTALARGERGHAASERRFLLPDGSQAWARLTLCLIRGVDGEPDHLLALLDQFGGIAT